MLKFKHDTNWRLHKGLEMSRLCITLNLRRWQFHYSMEWLQCQQEMKLFSVEKLLEWVVLNITWNWNHKILFFYANPELHKSSCSIMGDKFWTSYQTTPIWMCDRNWTTENNGLIGQCQKRHQIDCECNCNKKKVFSSHLSYSWILIMYSSITKNIDQEETVIFIGGGDKEWYK